MPNPTNPNRTERPAAAKPAIAPVSGMAPAPLHEVSQPLQSDAGGVVYADGTRMTPQQRARENMRELAPLVFEQPPLEGVEVAGVDPFYARLEAFSGQPVPEVKRIKRLQRPTVLVLAGVLADGPGTIGEAASGASGALVDEVSVPAAATDAAAPAAPAAPATPLPLQALPEDEQLRMPAASDTDSPARGVPRIAIPRGKEITGGFGEPAMLQYFALNGKELLALLDRELSALYARCENDLRFNEGLCYPRVTMRVVVEVRGYVSEADFTVDRILAPTDPATSKNPIPFCREVADEVAFVLLEEQREVDDAGQSLNPPGQVRQELGLPQVGKRRIKSGRGSTFVDIV